MVLIQPKHMVNKVDNLARQMLIFDNSAKKTKKKTDYVYSSYNQYLYTNNA